MVAAVVVPELSEDRHSLGRAGVRRHQRETQPTAGFADTRELACRLSLVCREDDTEGRQDDVEGSIRVWQGLRIANVETDIEALVLSTGPSTLDAILGDVDPCYGRTGVRGQQRKPPGSRTDVKDGLVATRPDELDEGCLRTDVPAFETLP